MKYTLSGSFPIVCLYILAYSSFSKRLIVLILKDLERLDKCSENKPGLKTNLRYKNKGTGNNTHAFWGNIAQANGTMNKRL